MHEVLMGQPAQQQKIDSVRALFTGYFNAKDVDKIYALTGAAFQKQLTPAAFRQVCNNNLFPLGAIKETVFENFTAGVSKYKAVFNSVSLSLFLSLDNGDKIQTLLFQPYKDDKAKKTARPPFVNPLATPLDKKVDSIMQPFIMQLNTVGVSIAVFKDGKTYYYGYGETAKENGKVPSQNTIFEIGSISKTFTATLLADAVNKGKIKLDDPVNKYLPDSIPAIVYEGVPVTIKSMINHSSGLPRMPGNYDFDGEDPYKEYDDSKMFSFYKHFTPTRKPGAQYEYSNLAVGTIGVILERLYSDNYEHLLFKTITKPLGMNDTREYLRTQDSARFAKGYDNGQYAAPWNFEAFMGAGGIRSTAADLVKYAKAQLGDAPAGLARAIALTHIPTFTTPQATVAMAWHIIKPGKDEVLFHNGGTGGYRSFLAINLQKKFAVVMLSNTTISVDGLGNALMKWLEGE
ncbi:MAG TPA: serine hydrolase domain-containing protein [Chitinophagaceae bacterium]|nr:serine hydrolase domain-containing protein [Chitinophagaceae bacterium]